MFRKIMIAAAAAATFAGVGLATAGAAGAGVVNGPITSNFLAGYQAGFNGGTAYNNVRATVHLPAETSEVTPDSVVIGVALQHLVSTGGFTAGLGFVFNDTHAAVCGTGQWTLEGATGDFHNGPLPIPPSDLSPVPGPGDSPVCLNAGQSYYIEVYYSTFHRTISFVAGPQEFTNESTLEVIPFWEEGIMQFYSAGVGVDTCSVAEPVHTACPSMDNGAAGLTNGTLAAFTRVGVTILLHPFTAKGTTNNRVTFDGQSLAEYVGTVNGGAATPTNPPTLTPTGFGSGSAFDILVP